MMLGYDMPRPEPAPKAAGRVAARHEAEYRRLLITTYMVIDEERGWTWAPNTYLSKQSGLSTGSVKRALDEMVRRGVIEVFDWCFGYKRRAIVLLDHPDAPELTHRLRNRISYPD